MPWKEHRTVDRREAFVRARLKGEQTMAELCREFGVSRKTGYKWEQRFLDGGMPNLIDRASRPHVFSRITPAELVQRIVAVRQAHSTWGPKKIAQKLRREDPTLMLPVISTIAAILKREGLIQPRRPRRRTPQSTFPLAAATSPNVVWCTDFKGKFRVDRKYCYPLTITDACSRYVLRCEPLEAERIEVSKEIFAAAFQEFGLPMRMRSDNGRPFATTAIGGLSTLSIWWIKLGILPERITPGCPQQNGRHERMHRTLKAEVASPPRDDWQAQKQALEAWRYEFNHVRPHEALDMQTPASRYEHSSRKYDAQVGDPEYPGHFETRRVSSHGWIKVREQVIVLSKVLCRECVGLEPIEDGLWHLWFGPIFLGRLRQLGRSKFYIQKEIPNHANPTT
jgi:transposase InsO family protein